MKKMTIETVKSFIKDSHYSSEILMLIKQLTEAELDELFTESIPLISKYGNIDEVNGEISNWKKMGQEEKAQYLSDIFAQTYEAPIISYEGNYLPLSPNVFGIADEDFELEQKHLEEEAKKSLEAKKLAKLTQIIEKEIEDLQKRLIEICKTIFAGNIESNMDGTEIENLVRMSEIAKTRLILREIEDVIKQ